jgi:hypothetical protein
VVDATVDLVEELAQATPLLVGLYDLQWADASSLLATTAVARRLRGAPIVLVTCRRPAPQTQDLRRNVARCRPRGRGRCTWTRSPGVAFGTSSRVRGCRAW